MKLKHKIENEVSKKLLYIDHTFHNKTKSAQFLEDLLNSVYDVQSCFLDPYEDNLESKLKTFEGQKFDVLVLFQVMPDIESLKKNIQAKHFVFFPMFDGSGGLENEFWNAYREFNIINFSRTLHERLLSMGLSSYYVQYFPKPLKTFEYGDLNTVYFWQRVSELNIDIIEKLLRKMSINKIHVHKVLDPLEEFKAPSAKIADIIKYSGWYDTREEMLRDMEACAIYIAPRPYEGIGMSFLEAMAMGRCVIAPDHPTMNEYITHGINGLLYDFHLVNPLKLVDIRRIQKNAFEYIEKGYLEWEKDKYKIIKWLEAPLQTNTSSSFKGRHHYMAIKSYRLFGLIPYLTIKSKPYKKYYYLFGILRVMKSKRKKNGVMFYLFDIIPVWKV